MVYVNRFLTSQQKRRLQLLSLTRTSRRNCARIRASIHRQESINRLPIEPCETMEDIISDYPNRQSFNQPLLENVQRITFGGLSEIMQENQEPISMPNISIRLGGPNRQFMQEPFMNSVQEGVMQNLNEYVPVGMEENSMPTISFVIGDVKNIKDQCLSISHNFSSDIAIAVRHPSTLPLVHGYCTLHSLGAVSYQCHYCGAQLWKSETISTLNGVKGKHCCGQGKVSLLPLETPPRTISELLLGDENESKAFRKYIRAYNAALAFVSLGAHVDDQFTRGGGVYTFRIHGMIYHRVGSLLPHGEENVQPKFAQLYVYDTEHELLNRLQLYSGLHTGVMERLQRMLHESNPYARVLRSMRDMLQEEPWADLKMNISETRSTSRQYLVPVGSEVAAIMPGQGNDADVGHRDIQFFTRNGHLKRISNLHRCYMPLLYVLLFPKGEDGWHAKIPLFDGGNRQFVTQRQYYAYRLQIRMDTNACLLRGGRLLQQFIVDAYSSMEESRLMWLRNNQTNLRAEVYQGLADMLNSHDSRQQTFLGGIGRRVVLPSSFTGGPRYMHQLYQDSMAIVRKKGKPDLFITFTCNPKWQEINDALLPGQSAQDRPDLTSRVFYQKHKDLMNLLLKKAVFGKVVGYVYVIEFQKRGLPHSHILLILEGQHKPVNICDYDKLICAELPDKDMFPDLYKIISQSNIHGPCGPLNTKAPCMIEGRCRHRYPRTFSDTTVVDANGYASYMRRDDGRFVELRGNKLDCRWVVPYNPFLSLRYSAHINIEACSNVTAVKYLYKYVFKGHDRATIHMSDSDGVIDEISSYLDARYVSASEACWRIYEYDMHEEKPDIQRLQVHLPNQNDVMFRDDDDLHNLINQERIRKTTLTEWFTTNQLHPEANDLLYIDFPCHWVWKKNERVWTKRQKGNTIGRMYNISPAAGEQYYLRILLTVTKGCKSFQDVRTVDGQVHPDFKAACLARGLLESDEEWFACIQEAAFLKTGSQLRQLFVVILIFCEPIYPGLLWERFSLELSEDFCHRLQERYNDLNVCQMLARNSALLHIDSLLHQYGRQLSDFNGMPIPDRRDTQRMQNTLLLEEMLFDAEQQRECADRMERSLNPLQLNAYNRIMEAVQTNSASVFFLDGPGGSGKTYVYNALLSRLRGDNKIALACASSGIASLLLTNGRTAHSRFKIPLVLHEASTCNIKVNSPIAELLKATNLIIWDEAPMTHRYAFEALDRTLQDIMQNTVVFGGKVMLFGGDFRQVLPVVRKGSRADIVDATICRSRIWNHVVVLKLSQNMRVVHNDSDRAQQEFCKWVLDIGNGINQEKVCVPQQMLLDNGSLQKLIEWVYQNLQYVQQYANFFKDRAILAPRNQEVEEINEFALNHMPGSCKEYLSADSIAFGSNSDAMLYTSEYLNSLNLGGGYPPHRLVLKANAPVMLLRNLDPRRGLCNGTRLICKNFHSKVIEAEIITGTNIGDRVFIPRITFLPVALQLPFEMRRKQFPLRLAFGMTINKAQGQTLGILGLYLATPVFSHGQLYVAMSRVRSSNAVKVYMKNNQHDDRGFYTENVVFNEVMQMAITRS